MPTQVAFFASIAFSLVAWGTVTARAIWPALRQRSRARGSVRAIAALGLWPGRSTGLAARSSIY